MRCEYPPFRMANSHSLRFCLPNVTIGLNMRSMKATCISNILPFVSLVAA